MSVARDFRALVDKRGTTHRQVRDFLDGLTPEERRDAIRGIHGMRRQRKLFELAESGHAFGLADLVPESFPPLRQVVFYGQNSLLAFTEFEKRFCRPSKDGDDRLYGYNDQTLSFATGPGYFTARSSADEPGALGPVALDYNEVPDEKPLHWPKIQPNERGLSHVVFAKMVDYLRALSDDVFIGRAVRRGRKTHNYFLLSRE